jgi:quinol monooxygenase YgiN
LIHLIVTFEASGEKLAAFRQILFTLVETWESEGAHRAHIERVVQSGGWEHIRAHLVSDPLSSYLREV